MNKKTKTKWTTKKERNELLKELHYSEEDMEKFFNEGAEVNVKLRTMRENGITWDCLPLNLIKELPTIKEVTLKKQEEEKKKREYEEQLKKKSESYVANFEDIMYSKIESKEQLTEEELSDLVCDYGFETNLDANNDGRWVIPASTVVSLKGKYFMIDWFKGKTELQENEYPNQPYEVEPKEKVITIKVWEKKEKEEV